MHLALLPLSTTDLGWFCLAAAILLSAMIALWVLLVAPPRVRATESRRRVTPGDPAPQRDRITTTS